MLDTIATNMKHTGPLASVPDAAGSRSQTTEAHLCISLLGELRVWLERGEIRVEVPLKSLRRQELLAYIATIAPDRSRRISSGRILTDVFEHIAPGADVDNLRGLFQKHTQLLRKEVNHIAKAANFPPFQLLRYEKVDNSSTRWWLSEECKVVDLTALRQLHEQMDATREEETRPDELFAASSRLVQFYQSHQGDYLEKHLAASEFHDADWISAPFTEYREMYLQALWDTAVFAHTTSLQPEIDDQQRYRYAKRAAQYYKIYALYAPKHRNLDLNVKKNRRQSERALRGFLRMCRWLMDTRAADDGYSEYESLMAREFPEWKPNIHTVEILRMIRQHSGEALLLRDALEPPEA